MTDYITSVWNPRKAEETFVTFSAGWQELHQVAKLDHLKDTIAELTKIYNQTLSAGAL